LPENKKLFRILLWQDVAWSIKSARGSLFLVLFGIFWFWILWKLSQGQLQSWLKTGDSFIASFIWGAGVAKDLIIDKPTTLSIYLIFALTTMPFFAILAACDQTASDISSKYLRFLISRCTRAQVFLARFFGVVILVTTAYIAVTFFVILISLSIDGFSTPDTISYGIKVALTVAIYSLPFIAIMAFLSAAIPSAALSALTGMGSYAILAIVISILPQINSNFSFFGYILPSGFKQGLYNTEFSTYFPSMLAVLIFVPLFVWLAWLVFSKRDI